MANKKKSQKRPFRRGKPRDTNRALPDQAVLPADTCPIDGKPHTALVFPQEAKSPWSERLDRIIMFDGRGNDASEGFRVHLSICTKCRLVYMAKFARADVEREAEVDALRKELAEATVQSGDDDPADDSADDDVGGGDRNVDQDEEVEEVEE